MAELLLQHLVRSLCRAVDAGVGANSDAELLSRFALRRDEQAFELLVWRHGAMVLNLCRRVLRHDQDAEDAFQAAFLALALEAGKIARRAQAAGWLYRVAFRIALKIRAQREREQARIRARSEAVGGLDASDETRTVIDQEIARLPDRFRLPFLMCCLEGRSNSEAAEALGCPKGTIDSRLATAKRKLRDRLVRRGVTLSAAAAALTALGESECSAALSNTIVRSTVAAASALVADPRVAGPIVSLARGVIQTMFVEKIRRVAIFVAVVALISGAAGGVLRMAEAGGPQPGPQKAADDSPRQKKGAAPAAPATKPPEPKTTPDARAMRAQRAQDVREKLVKVVDIERSIQAPLRDVLEFLSDRFDVSIFVDHSAFARIGYRDFDRIADVPVKLARMPGVSLQMVLDLMLATANITDGQPGLVLGVTAKSGALMIVPVIAQGDGHNKDSNKGATEAGLQTTLVGGVVTLFVAERPLTEVLRELADETGANIVLDNRAKDKAQVSISVTLQNAPLLSAVRVVVDMADLKVAELDNILYVTTADNAARIEKEHQEAEKKRKRIPKFGGGGPAM